MKLNLRLIMESLDPPYTDVFGSPDRALYLTDAYPYVGGRGDDAPDILYVAAWEQLRRADELPQNLICVGGGAEARALFGERRLTGLICPADSDVFAVLREVQEVFSRYGKLERELLDALLLNAPIRAILNACANFLKCHVSLYGTELRLLDYSDKYLPPDSDLLWKETLTARRSAIPRVPREKVSMLPSNPKDFPRATYVDIGGGVPRHLNIAFDFGDLRIATLIFSETEKRLHEHHLWLADYIGDLIHPTIIERYNTFFDLRNNFRISIATALRHANMDSTFLMANLARFGWRANDDYQILLVALPQENSHVSHYLYNYENVFAETYSDNIALHHDDYIFILLHNGACAGINRCFPALKKQLEMDDGICSVGQKFCDFSQLKLQYDLAALPLHMTALGRRRIRYYRDIMVTHLVNELSSCFPLRATCHHAAVRVHEYDRMNGTDFLMTLETYLLNNKSLITASDKLFIHRSTLTYRLKCIEKIAPMQLEDPCERLHILLSCIALRTLSGSGALSDTTAGASPNGATLPGAAPPPEPAKAAT